MLGLSIVYLWGRKYARFAVPIPVRGSVYMSFELRSDMNDQSAVVIVTAEKFLRLWRNEPLSIHRIHSFGNAATWQANRKYLNADRGYAQGPNNPVPLAQVGFATEVRHHIAHRFLCFGRSEWSEVVPFVGFTNGVTRTIWLLANRCDVFPVECSLPGAHGLQAAAGADGTSLLTVEGLEYSTQP
jgi:hypothetical protein